MTSLAASFLAACGGGASDGAAGGAGQLLTPERVAQVLPPEARAVVTSYEQDLRNAASAYVAQYGRLPASIAELTTMAGARQVAITAVADQLAGQVPFASRATLESAATGLVGAAEKQVFDRMKVQDAPNP